MTTPSKFDMGRMPRTKTGLVPTSFRRKMENLSTTTNWSPLPPKPKPPMYPYRGDYVNERNRKKQKPKQRSFDPSRKRGDSNTPSLSVIGERIPPYNSWDSYCKHVSYHKLSEDEQRSKARNKNEFVSYLRSSAAKRGPVTSKDKVVQQTVAETIVRQRKPPVPRLSHLARTGEEKEILQSSANESKLKKSGQARKENSSNNGYLDFISNKKVDGSRISPHDAKVTTKARIDPGSNFRCDEDDDIKSQRQKSQIQRIVERAAEIVLKDQHRGSNGLASLDEGICINIEQESTSSSLAEIFADAKTTSDIQRKSKFVRNGYPGQPHRSRAQPVESFYAGPNNEFFQKQNEQLSILEERVRSMSSSVVSGADWFSSSLSHNSYTTSVGHSRDDDSMIGMPPSVQLLPMIKLLHNADPGSFASSSSGNEDRLTVSESASFDVSVDAMSSSMGRLKGVENSPHTGSTTTWSWSDTISGKSQPSFDTCPVESLPPTVNPSIEPTRISTEEEPLPRGCKHTLQGYGTTNRDYPRTSQYEIHDSFIDDVYSLFSAFDS